MCLLMSPVVTVRTMTQEGRDERQHEYIAGPLYRSLRDAGAFKVMEELVLDLMKAGRAGLGNRGVRSSPTPSDNCIEKNSHFWFGNIKNLIQ